MIVVPGSGCPAGIDVDTFTGDNNCPGDGTEFVGPGFTVAPAGSGGATVFVVSPAGSVGDPVGIPARGIDDSDGAGLLVGTPAFGTVADGVGVGLVVGMCAAGLVACVAAGGVVGMPGRGDWVGDTVGPAVVVA